jgi:hypothetical protein
VLLTTTFYYSVHNYSTLLACLQYVSSGPAEAGASPGT